MLKKMIYHLGLGLSISGHVARGNVAEVIETDECKIFSKAEKTAYKQFFIDKMWLGRGILTLTGKKHPSVVTAAKTLGSKKRRAARSRLAGYGTPYRTR